jgi:predicted DCC family thiol-disulfide oxidoreductase YuxK
MDFLARRDAKLSAGSSSGKKIRLTDIESDSYDANDPINGGVTYERGMAAIHAVTSDGRVFEGPLVFSKAYDLVELGWLFKFTEWQIMKPLVQYGYELFARYRTIVTRGATLEDLYAAKKKKVLTQNGKDDECDVCNDIRRR